MEHAINRAHSAHPSSLPPVPWSLADAAKGLLLAFAGAALLILAGSALHRVLGRDQALGVLLLSLALEGVLLLAVGRYGPWRYGRSWQALGLGEPGKAGVLLSLAAFLTILGMSLLYTSVVGLLGLDWLQPPGLPIEVNQSILTRAVTFLVTVLVAPFAEEAFFRGFLLPAFAGQWGFLRAAVASSLLFALSHASLGLVAPAFVSGLLLAWLYRRTGSLWSSCLAHGFQNLVAFSAVMVGP
ncbi:MAG: CPBP family intramembrane metalloprotease [Chloroflexi bacterium]|nr:CPBP family intramembrane metalloprotease [Chloroflexota bacterium]